MYSLYLLAVAISACLLSLTKADEPLLINTNLGQVQGYIDAGGARLWKGIPYAQPPVGELRWEKPLVPNPYQGIYDASYNAPGCPQVCKLPPGNCPEWGTDENCLYLSVYSPNTPAPPEGFPVLFWIHGGAFEQGLGNCALYNGTNFANKNVVTVAINYRLGALGFLAAENMEGNYGFLDQRMALQWTVDNIHAFGGNPNKITIAGQSAGAMSVGAHLISPGSKGLFQSSIMESNPLGLPFHSRESAATNANNFATYLNCPVNDVDCLRTKSVDEILDAQANSVQLDLSTLLLNFLPFAPMYEEDGEIPDQPLYALAEAKFQTFGPLLQGSVADEGQLFVNELFVNPLSESAYNLVLDGVFGVKNARTIKKFYPFGTTNSNGLRIAGLEREADPSLKLKDSTDGRSALNVLATDLLFYCPLRNITTGFQNVLNPSKKLRGNTETVPTFIYKMDHVLSFDCWGPDYAFCPGYVCHGSDLPLVFNVYTDGVSVDYTPSSDEVQLTEEMSNAWSNFITNGDPNTGFSIPVAYPQYYYKVDEIIALDEPGMETVEDFRSQYCDLWDSLGYFY